jgi:phage terminase large subunit-like protein
MPAEMREAVEAERALRRGDPLRGAIAGLTRVSTRSAGTQWGFYTAKNTERVLEGGNQSGKTWSNCTDFLSQGRGLHEFATWAPKAPTDNWRGWYCTTTYERFAEQGWGHFKKLLLYPGESVYDLPTRNILAIAWDTKNPERPLYLRIRRTNGAAAEIWIKSYEQGAREFQSAEVDCLVLDEECPDSIYEEAQPRVMSRRGRIQISATPVVGVRWLEDLRTAAEVGGSDIYHCRLDTRDNPAMDMAEWQRLEAKWAVRPELVELRLSGIPIAAQGAVYNDLQFTPAHVCEPFTVPDTWTRYLCIDPGYNYCGALWFACGPAGDVVCYREYLGHERTTAQNAAEILKRCGGERYHDRLIDPAAMGRSSQTGEREIDLWIKGGVQVIPAPDNAVMTGIESVWQMLAERAGVDGERPRFRTFRSNIEFLRERRGYKFQETREKGDEKGAAPVKRNDHLMDPWRYGVARGLRYVPVSARPPTEGTRGRRLWEKRREPFKNDRPRL